MKVKILEVQKKPFLSRAGEDIAYFWYKALREEDGVTFRFGSRDGDHRPNLAYDLDIEKRETEKGKIIYAENVSAD